MGRQLHGKSRVERLVGNLSKQHQMTARNLFSEDYSTRYLAINRLAKLGVRKAIPLIEKKLDDPDSFVRLTAIEALGKLDSEGSIPLIEKRMVHDTQAYNVVKAMFVLAEFGSVKSIPLMEKMLAGKFRLQGTDALQARLTKTQVVRALGKLTRQKNNRFFEGLDRRLGKEQQRDGYSIVLHKNYYFKVYPATLWGEKDGRNKGARVLEIKVGGKPKCALGFVGNSVLFVQIVGEVPKRGKMYELAVEEYLKMAKPLLLGGENIYLDVNEFNPHLKPLRDRFCNKAGIINRNKERVRKILNEE